MGQARGCVYRGDGLRARARTNVGREGAGLPAWPGELGWGLSSSRVPPGDSSSLPAVQAGFAEASHQNPGDPLPAEPTHRSRRLRHARAPRPATSRCHHPLPSPDPRTSPFPNTTSPRPHHAGPHRLRTLLEPPARRGSVCRGSGCATGAARCRAAVPGRLLLQLVGNHRRRHQPWLLLCFERAPAEARSPGRAQPAPPCIPTAPPRLCQPRAWKRSPSHGCERTVPKSPGPSCSQGCLSSAHWLLVHHPPSYQTGRRGADWSLGEGASLRPASPCQPRAKGPARGVSAQLLLGKTTPAQRKAGSSPLRPCWLCPRQPCAWLGWLGVSMLPTSPLCPTTPYVPPAKEPPMWRAAATLTVSSLREQ